MLAIGGIKSVGVERESEINPPMLKGDGLMLLKNMVWGFLKIWFREDGGSWCVVNYLACTCAFDKFHRDFSCRAFVSKQAMTVK